MSLHHRMNHQLSLAVVVVNQTLYSDHHIQISILHQLHYLLRTNPLPQKLVKKGLVTITQLIVGGGGHVIEGGIEFIIITKSLRKKPLV